MLFFFFIVIEEFNLSNFLLWALQKLATTCYKTLTKHYFVSIYILYYSFRIITVKMSCFFSYVLAFCCVRMCLYLLYIDHVDACWWHVSPSLYINVNKIGINTKGWFLANLIKQIKSSNGQTCSFWCLKSELCWNIVKNFWHDCFGSGAVAVFFSLCTILF